MSDVFHTSSPDSPFWEFKHGNGNFKRGDLVGLRDIKRRASRHTLAHRDSISSATKFAVPQNAPPPEQIADSLEARLTTLERNFFDAHARLTRSEETCANLNARCQQLSDTLMQSYQVRFTPFALACNARLATHSTRTIVNCPPLSSILCQTPHIPYIAVVRFLPVRLG